MKNIFETVLNSGTHLILYALFYVTVKFYNDWIACYSLITPYSLSHSSSTGTYIQNSRNTLLNVVLFLFKLDKQDNLQEASLIVYRKVKYIDAWVCFS